MLERSEPSGPTRTTGRAEHLRQLDADGVAGEDPEALAVVDKSQQGSLLWLREAELRVAPVCHGHDPIVLLQRRSLQNGGVLTQGHLELFRILQRFLQELGLSAITVMIALPAGEQKQLGTFGHILLTTYGRRGQQNGR